MGTVIAVFVFVGGLSIISVADWLWDKFHSR